MKPAPNSKAENRNDTMNPEELLQNLESVPVIPAVKDDVGLERCLSCESKVVFVLYGSVNTIRDIVLRQKEAGKTVFVHIDLLDGLSAREAAVEYLIKNVAADGIISTKSGLIRFAHSRGLLTVQRYFVLDSLALENIIGRTDPASGSDLVEILPGLMPKIIARLAAEIRKPIIAGGLISDKADIMAALNAGAVAISSTNRNVWFM
jgi:glycerol-3-phosphate responsive antiterminator